MRYGKPADRIISRRRPLDDAVPEFVWGVVLVLIFTPIRSAGCRSSSTVPPGSSELAVYGHLFLPAIPLVFVLFGYIMRIARAGTIEALDADYTRTAYLKGLTRGVVIRRHVLRNSLLPTITVVATQIGYLIGGLAIVETLFNYPGIGYLILQAAKRKDFPLLESACSRSGSSTRSRRSSPTCCTRCSIRASGLALVSTVDPVRSTAEDRSRARRAGAHALRPRGHASGACSRRRRSWSACSCCSSGSARAIFGEHLTKSAYDRATNTLQGMSSAHWFGTDKLGRDVFARVIAGSREIMIVAALATILGVVGGTVLGLVTGYFRGVVDNAISRVMDAVLAIPLDHHRRRRRDRARHLERHPDPGHRRVFTPLIARTVRTAVLVERDLDYVQAAKLRGERAPYIMFVEILPNVTAPILVEATVRLGYAIFFIASLSFLGYGVQPPSPDWGAQVADNYTLISFAWWTVLFPSLAIASLVISVNLIATASRTWWTREHRRAVRRSRPRPPPPWSCATSTSRTGCAAWIARCCAASACASSGARASAWSASPAAASRRPRSRSCATCRATARCDRDRCSSTDATSGASADASCASCARLGLDGLPEPRGGAEPVDPHRAAGRRGLHRRGVAAARRASAHRHAAQGADRRPRLGDAALPAPALGRHAAARRDRDGARDRSDAADPRRADDRPRRDRRGRGARPHPRRCAASSARRSSSSATTSA